MTRLLVGQGYIRVQIAEGRYALEAEANDTSTDKEQDNYRFIPFHSASWDVRLISKHK